MNIATSLPGFIIRSATIADCDLILTFIKELGEYEKLTHEIVATNETLAETLLEL